MRKHKTKSIQQVTSSDRHGLAAIAQHAKRLGIIDGAIKPILPAELRPHVQVANIRGDILVLIADSSAWAARTRYLSAQILQSCSSVCKERLRKVEVRLSESRARRPNNTQTKRGPRSDRVAARELEALRRQLGIDGED